MLAEVYYTVTALLTELSYSSTLNYHFLVKRNYIFFISFTFLALAPSKVPDTYKCMMKICSKDYQTK